METVDISNLFQGSTSMELQKQFIGSEHSFPPNTTNLGAAWINKTGTIQSRTIQAPLWKWVQDTQGAQIVTDAAWLQLEIDAPNGAVSVYSSGDGSTTFRVPTVGDGGFDRAKGVGITDPVLLNIGFASQIEDHSHATPIGYTNSAVYLKTSDGAVYDEPWGSAPNESGKSDNRSSASFVTASIGATSIPDALTSPSTYSNTGETTPQGQYVAVFIYTGSDIIELSPVEYNFPPNDNLIINGDYTVNQRGVSGAHAGNVFTLDRWYFRGNVGPTTIDQGYVLGIGNTYDFDITTATSYWAKYQRIEDINGSLMSAASRGESLTTSFLFSNPTGEDFDVQYQWRDITANNYPDATPDNTRLSVGTVGYQKVVVTMLIPAVPTGFDPTHEYALQFRLISVTSEVAPDGLRSLGQMKVEYGSLATPFVADDAQTNLAKCQRYYEEGLFSYTGITNGTTLAFYNSVPFLVQKRVNPSIVLSGGTNTTGQGASNDSGFVSVNKFDWKFQPASSSELHCRVTGKEYIADAEL